MAAHFRLARNAKTLSTGSPVTPSWFYKLKTVLPQPRVPIFLADNVFLHFKVCRLQLVDFLSCPGPRIDLGILERDLDFQGVMVHAPETLHEVKSVAMRMAQSIDPSCVVYCGRIHHQRISIIFADRVPHPRARIAVGMSPPVHVDSADPVIHLGKDVNLLRSLTDLERPGNRKDTGWTRRKTAATGINIVSSF